MDMKKYIKYLMLLAFLCLYVDLRGQDVNFNVVMNGNVVSYTAMNNTSTDMYIIQHREPTMENGSHCLVTYRDNSGTVNYRMLSVMDRFAVLIKPQECYSYDIDISEYKNQKLMKIYCKAVVIIKNEHGKPYIKKYDKSITF